MIKKILNIVSLIVFLSPIILLPKSSIYASEHTNLPYEKEEETMRATREAEAKTRLAYFKEDVRKKRQEGTQAKTIASIPAPQTKTTIATQVKTQWVTPEETARINQKYKKDVLKLEEKLAKAIAKAELTQNELKQNKAETPEIELAEKIKKRDREIEVARQNKLRKSEEWELKEAAKLKDRHAKNVKKLESKISKKIAETERLKKELSQLKKQTPEIELKNKKNKRQLKADQKQKKEKEKYSQWKVSEAKKLKDNYAKRIAKLEGKLAKNKNEVEKIRRELETKKKQTPEIRINEIKLERQQEQAEEERRAEEKAKRQREREARIAAEKQKREELERQRKEAEAKRHQEEYQRLVDEMHAEELAAKEEAAAKGLKEKKMRRELPKKQLPIKEKPAQPTVAPKRPRLADDVRKRVNTHLSRAQDLIEEKKYKEARIDLQQAITLDPDNLIAANLISFIDEENVRAIKKTEPTTLAEAKETEKKMQNEYLAAMNEIDQQIQEIIQEGNDLYAKRELPGANKKYREVRKLEAQRQEMTEALLKDLQKRTQDAYGLMTPEEKRERIEELLAEAKVLTTQEKWDEAAEVYESVFLIDPLSPEASKGLDDVKKRFLEKEKAKKESAAEVLKSDFQNRIDFYLSEAKKAKAQGQLDQAVLFTKKALIIDSDNKEAKRLLESLSKEGGQR